MNIKVDGKEYKVERGTLTLGRCIINYDGLFVLVDKNPRTGEWELSGRPADDVEKKALEELTQQAGMKDQTVLTVTKDD